MSSNTIAPSMYPSISRAGTVHALVDVVGPRPEDLVSSAVADEGWLIRRGTSGVHMEGGAIFSNESAFNLYRGLAHVCKDEGAGLFKVREYLNVVTTFTKGAPLARRNVSAEPQASQISELHISSVSARLDRLKDGWAGPGSVAPSQGVIDDVALACVAIYQAANLEPEVEVDEDGTVVLEWRRGQRAFCLTFLGNRRLVGTISPWTEGYGPWQAQVSDELLILSKLEDPAVESFVRR